jgi:hypothetical protein
MAIRIFFDIGQMPEGVNETTIVFLTKKEDLECLKDFR